MKVHIFKEIILNFQKELLPVYTKRRLVLHEVEKMSLASTGVQRAGKTYRT